MNHDDELVRYTLTRPPTGSTGGRAPILIAEIGSSPAPEWWFERWCSAAKLAGATHIKAQMFKADHFPPEEQAVKRPLEFPRKRLPEFVQVAHEHGLQAGVSVFDFDAVMLAGAYCDFFKLAAREAGNRWLIDCCHYHESDKPIYRSVSRHKLDEFMLLRQFTTLFAIQKYPASLMSSVWSLALWSRFAKCELLPAWGWSSHTRGWLDCWLAALLGASVIEKHLRLSPDDAEAGWSLPMSEFRRMAERIGVIA